MKRILVAIALAILCVACCPQQTRKSDILEDVGQWLENNSTMPQAAFSKKGSVRGLDNRGDVIDICTAYFGEYNGHTWYVFYGMSYSIPAVVHDPLCKCKEKKYDTLE